MDPRLLPLPALDKKRTFLLLRSVLAISTSYLILFGETRQATGSIAYILALILSNVALAFVPARWFQQAPFSAALLLTDTAVVLAGLYLTVGCFSQDFLIIYFFTIFLTTATSGIAQIAVGAAIISGVYGYWLWLSTAHVLGSGEWLRLPFFFIVAVFYAYVTEETKYERYSRQRAEREAERLRCLLQLGSRVSQTLAAQEMAAHVGSLIEAALPRLRCPAHPGEGVGVPLQCHDRDFGALRVATRDGSALRANEIEFCKVVAVIAANALYTAEQITAAQEGVRLKDEFLATLSHELRSPLHVILGNAELLEEALPAPVDPFVRETVERLRANACRLFDLVEEMLSFAELRAGRATVHALPLDVRELIEQCAANMSERLAGRPIRFELAVGVLPTVESDSQKLRFILNALLSNAAKFTERGFIRVSAEPVGDGIEIAVHDSGIGIAPDDLPHIFEAFRQADSSLTRRFSGLGLGLALAQELAALLGGRITVESAPQAGSTFSVQIPVRYRGATPDAVGATSAPLLAAPRLLRLRPAS